MKDIIIEKIIEQLKSDGLKFNVDQLAIDLRISKKTLYKYFDTKQEMALGVYKRLYLDIEKELEMIFCKEQIDIKALNSAFSYYMEALFYIREELFNRYSLNEIIYDYAKSQLIIVWEQLRKIIEHSQYYEILDYECLKETIDSSLSSFSIKSNKDKLCLSFVQLLVKKI